MRKATAILLFIFACAITQAQSLMPGDLLFYEDTAGMGAAVRQSTGRYTHVAMVAEVGDTVYIIDATTRRGVARRPLLRSPYPAVYRLAIPFDTVGAIRRAEAMVGQPYDDWFQHDNGRLYCSELIYECYLDSAGNHLFEAQPMNFLAPDGTLPPYWQTHFSALGIEVPQGQPGTNPTDLSRSPLLKRVF